MKKMFFVAIAMLLGVSVFARTKKEINAEISALSKVYWGFPYNKAFVAYEKDVLLKNPEYTELYNSKKEAEKKIREYYLNSIAKMEGGAAVADRCRKARAALEASPEDRALIQEDRLADIELDKFAKANKFSLWAGEGRPLMMADRELHFKKFDKAAELMAAGDNEEMKALSKRYTDARTKEAALREEMKTAE